MKSVTQTLVLNSPKKHSVRYDATADKPSGQITSSLYVNKLPLAGATPKEIKVTVEWEE